MEDRELLQYALEHGMINMSYVQEQIEMNKRKEILEKHGSGIWYNEKEGMWYCHIPDPIKGRVKRKRKKRSDIEEVLFQAYYEIEKKSADSITFEELFYEFIAYKKSQVGKGTVKRMMSDWKKFYKPHKEFTDMPVSKINKISIDQLLNSITSEHKPKDKAFRNLCGVVKQTLEYAVDAEYIEKSPYRVKINKKNIIHTRKKPSEKEIFRYDEKELLFEEFERKLELNPSNTVPLSIMLDFEIGVRVGELVAFRRSDIRKRRIHVQRQRIKAFDDSEMPDDIKETGWETVNYTKSDCGDRYLPLTDYALEIIERIIKINEQFGLVNEDYLFVNNTNHDIITEDAISAQLRRACQKVKIPVRRPHKIRKTYASVLYANNVPITVISKLLGHADESTTLKHYIFNISDDRETEDIVLKALQPQCDNDVTRRDQKLIPFPVVKKSGNLSKIKASPI